MRPPLVAAGAALVAFGGAVFMGWRAYIGNPQGVLLYTPRGPCPSLAHSFSVTFTFWLLAAALGAAVFAALAMAAGLIRKSVERSRGAVRTALWMLPWLALLWCTHPVFETVFPQVPDPNCEKHAS